MARGAAGGERWWRRRGALRRRVRSLEAERAAVEVPCDGAQIPVPSLAQRLPARPIKRPAVTITLRTMVTTTLIGEPNGEPLSFASCSRVKVRVSIRLDRIPPFCVL